MVVAVVVKVEHSVDFRVEGHVDLLCALDAFGEGLAGVLLHLDVVEFPGNTNKERRLKPIRFSACKTCIQSAISLSVI
jgi:hypothetical protein